MRGSNSKATIEVMGNNWGNVRHRDIKKLLENVASHLTRHLREEVSALIEVRNWERSPQIFYRLPGQTSYMVMLSTTGSRWAQYTYQFAHEFCHLLSNYENLKDSANNWFHESICEAASLFTLRSMATTWEAEPSPNWSSYAKWLWHYAEERVDTVRGELPEVDEMGSWLQGHESKGRMNSNLRKENRIVALRMLPVFEQHPEGWNAIKRLPRSDVLIAPYLAQWKKSAHFCDRSFIGQLQNALGQPVFE